MHMFQILLVLALLMGSIPGFGQRNTFNQWTAFNNVFTINKVLGINFDAQFRSGDQVKQFSTIILRPGLNVTFKKNFFGTLGYAFVPNRRSAMSVSDMVPEHRIWQQLQLTHPVGFTALTHRLRFEQRFIPTYVASQGELDVNGHDFTTRLRYFVRDIIPFKGIKQFTKGYFVSVQNEVFINTGDKSIVNGKHFDQNRLLLGIGRRFRKEFDLEAGYLNQYINGRNNSM